jgi:hypothetical protein
MDIMIPEVEEEEEEIVVVDGIEIQVEMGATDGEIECLAVPAMHVGALQGLVRDLN